MKNGGQKHLAPKWHHTKQVKKYTGTSMNVGNKFSQTD